jgi:DNA-binding ferritin-like protein
MSSKPDFKRWLIAMLLGANLILTIMLLLRMQDIERSISITSTTAKDTLTTKLKAQSSAVAEQITILGKIAKESMFEAEQLRREIHQSMADAKTATPVIDPLLTKQARIVADRINALGKISEGNVVEAAQLWREAQLTMEAAMTSPESPEFKRLSSSTASLQLSIQGVIPELASKSYNQARQKGSLKDALAKWAGAGAYIALYPNDGTPSSAERAQALGYEHERERQNLLQKAQTKYNLWACEQIKKAWVDIKDVNSPLSKSDNKKFFHSCVYFVAPIDPSLLDMATGELYREVLQFVRERMKLEDFQNLIKEIQNGRKVSLDSL